MVVLLFSLVYDGLAWFWVITMFVFLVVLVCIGLGCLVGNLRVRLFWFCCSAVVACGFVVCLCVGWL